MWRRTFLIFLACRGSGEGGERCGEKERERGKKLPVVKKYIKRKTENTSVCVTRQGETLEDGCFALTEEIHYKARWPTFLFSLSSVALPPSSATSTPVRFNRVYSKVTLGAQSHPHSLTPLYFIPCMHEQDQKANGADDPHWNNTHTHSFFISLPFLTISTPLGRHLLPLWLRCQPFDRPRPWTVYFTRA